MACYIAVVHGHDQCFEYLHTCGFFWDAHIYDTELDDCDVCDRPLVCNHPCAMNICSLTHASGYTDCKIFAQICQYPIDPAIIQSAARRDHRSHVLHTRIISVPHHVYAHVAETNDFSALQYLHEPLDPHARGNLNTNHINYHDLSQFNEPLDPHALDNLMLINAYHCIRWRRGSECYPGEQ
jgi:hypothetical protein